MCSSNRGVGYRLPAGSPQCLRSLVPAIGRPLIVIKFDALWSEFALEPLNKQLLNGINK